MTLREYILVLGTILTGLVPAFFSYQYLGAHPQLIASLVAGMSLDTTSARSSTAATILSTVQAAKIEVYQSRPQKETTGLCKNSYYMSFVLTLTAQNNLSLMKQCESARDTSVTWYGEASSSWALSDDAETSEINDFTITKNEKTVYENPPHIVLVRTGDTIRVTETELAEIATTTVFARVSSIPR